VIDRLNISLSDWQPTEPTLADWRQFFYGVEAGPRQVYAAMRGTIARHELPDVWFSEITYREAGPFSQGRGYLRVNRENHVFDICAAPYGSGFFVSWWLAEARPMRRGCGEGPAPDPSKRDPLPRRTTCYEKSSKDT
jgi:hypothetical protein